MTDFSMSNMDYTPVKFMIKVFEANYPESLGAVLVHKSPWIFHSIWTIIKGWLDPVVAGKVHFTKNFAELQEFIPKSQIMTELDGDEKWAYQYVEPEDDENALMRDTATRDRIAAERETLNSGYQKATFEWISKPQDEAVRESRQHLADQLHENYWQLDPYVRARTLYDRIGMIGKDGKINYYPQNVPAKHVSTTNRAPAQAAAPHTDDLD